MRTVLRTIICGLAAAIAATGVVVAFVLPASAATGIQVRHAGGLSILSTPALVSTGQHLTCAAGAGVRQGTVTWATRAPGSTVTVFTDPGVTFPAGMTAVCVAS